MVLYRYNIDGCTGTAIGPVPGLICDYGNLITAPTPHRASLLFPPLLELGTWIWSLIEGRYLKFEHLSCLFTCSFLLLIAINRKRRRRRRRRRGGGSNLRTWSISFPLLLFPPCWCLKAWIWSLQERRSSPLELGLEPLRRLGFEAQFVGLESSFGLDWRDSNSLLELERDFLLPRVLRDLWTTPFGETKNSETVRWV
uniref:Uncharacterized protein n=1 Tax=Ananas comosus var. bracteatus TaxID=296719 RepID=A0A6V7NIS1_ANACO|nr:unnamed protein product [Ananas comosus var. bracteatus]